ncbi:DUF2521 family protein [Alkalihalobacterium sp. APHAB7]|uniref:DUF2521 family protein n=1 Tax=Alkalihalobacterium sp. APHAB7 TaxID=3402081 RepID=UPI003AAF54F5
MTVITTFSEKQREKRWKFERKVLRQLSLNDLKKDAQQHFEPLFPFHFQYEPFLIDPIIDAAIDSFLIGAEFSRFGYYGELLRDVRFRCEDELKDIYTQLFYILEAWYTYRDIGLDSLYLAVEQFVEKWWEKGFTEGTKRYRMRLH